MSGEKTLKIILVGDVAVGKTALRERFARNTFSMGYSATIGIDEDIKNIGESGATLHVLDTAGQEEHQTLGTNFFKGADAILFVYDVTQQETFDNLSSQKLWQNHLESHPESANIPKFLVGMKTDLADQRVVSADEADAFASKQHFVSHHEASAETGEGVGELFQAVARVVLENQQEETEQDESMRDESTASSRRSINFSNLRPFVPTLMRGALFIGSGMALGAVASLLGMFALTAGALVGAGALAGLAAWGAYEVVNCGYKGCPGSEMGLCHSMWSVLPSPLACCSPSKGDEAEMELVESESDTVAPQN